MLLITGGAGFIGSNFVHYLSETLPEAGLVNLDALTYSGNPANLAGAERSRGYVFVRGDIGDRALLEELFERYKFTAVINFAAETHVDRSIDNPGVFLQTNVLGAQALLDAALQHWRLRPGDKYCREFKPGVKFIQISTDEVYGSLAEGLFKENSPLAPGSPYAASKAAADLLALAYWNTYGLPVNITRCSNNYGPYQFPEKLIPLMINNCLAGKSLPVYGDGRQIRDWLYVKDHCSAIYAVWQKGAAGEIYNIGGNNEKANIDLVRLIIKELGGREELIAYVKDRPGHDRRYAIDNTKITTELGWRPSYTFESGVKAAIAWYSSNKDWLNTVTGGEYVAYYQKMYGQGTDVSG